METPDTAVARAQHLPPAGPEREELREKGQFWTPSWLARIMVSWVTQLKPETLFDPAVGPGTFFSAARSLGYTGNFDGYEVDRSVLAESGSLGLTRADVARIEIADFISNRATRAFPAIVSNPPYIRHHRLSDHRKAELQAIARRNLGFGLDGRMGLHVYFLLKSLAHLSPCGRLAFLLPADVCEGVSSRALWNRLCERYRLEAVLTFEETAAPFPRVDTNAMVIFMARATPASRFRWLRVKRSDGDSISRLLEGAPKAGDEATATEYRQRDLAEALRTGLSRPPRPAALRGVPLGHFARIVRGIATGANEFFFLTTDQVKALGLEQSHLIRAIGRTRDCRDDVLRQAILDHLELTGRPTWLLDLGNTPKESLPVSVQSYLQDGERRQLHQRSLIRTRRPWYRMEQRIPPPILFAYLGRRDCRFILNEAGVVPLTGFLCVYPLETNQNSVKRLWQALNHPDTLKNLAFAGKSYGGGAVKVEPRQLDTLEIPTSVLRWVGLDSPKVTTELFLLDQAGQAVGHQPAAR